MRMRTLAIALGLTLAFGAPLHAQQAERVLPAKPVLIDDRAAALDAAQLAEFDAFVEHVSPGRAALVRAPSSAEMAGTRLLRISLDEAAAKIRTGGVIDAEEDMAIPVWAGVVPLKLRADPPEADAACASTNPPKLPALIDT